MQRFQETRKLIKVFKSYEKWSFSKFSSCTSLRYPKLSNWRNMLLSYKYRNFCTKTENQEIPKVNMEQVDKNFDSQTPESEPKVVSGK